MSEKQSETPLFDKFLDSLPDMMAEQMRLFNKTKDFNQRAKIRMKMKILLDASAVDTKYPDIPALHPGGSAYPMAHAALPGIPPPLQPGQQDIMINVPQAEIPGIIRELPRVLPGARVVSVNPIPGAYPEQENADILEPAGNVAPEAPNEGGNNAGI
jgi:hypothetical protein